MNTPTTQHKDIVSTTYDDIVGKLSYDEVEQLLGKLQDFCDQEKDDKKEEGSPAEEATETPVEEKKEDMEFNADEMPE